MKYEISSALRYIEIYKDKNWQKQLPRHVVNLHPGYEVRCKEEPKRKHCFSLKTTDHTLLLACDDESVIKHWMTTLEEYNLGGWNISVILLVELKLFAVMCQSLNCLPCL
jgi:hypothetical protein